MKYMAVFGMLLLLQGCGSSAEQYAPEVLPEGLKDCKFYHIKHKGSNMKVVRCPNSATSVTYKSGKTSRYLTTLEE